MDKITKNHLTARQLETIILGEIANLTEEKYKNCKTNFIMPIFTKEKIEKITNEKGSLTLVNAKTSTVEEIIKSKKAQQEKLQKEIDYLKTLDKKQIIITKNEYITRTASKETKEEAKEYINKMLEDFTSKSLKQLQ